MPKINLANKITLIRLSILPFIILLLYIGDTLGKLVSIILFLLIIIGDKIDGIVARKLNKATKFGSFLDSIADKLITSLMFIVLFDFRLVPLWAVLLFITRDLTTESVRSINFTSGVLPKRSKFSIYKTGLQNITILFGLIVIYVLDSDINSKLVNQNYNLIMSILIYVTLFFAYYSFIEVLYKNRKTLLKNA
ncbi:MAG: CDP-alcohol phosphatidyltransferase family protein [Candidatus Woesearchaeota archaeon]